MAKILRTAIFGGFKKKDVIGYLEELNMERQKEQAEQDKETRMLGDTIAQLHAQAEQLEQQLTDVRAAAEEEAEALKQQLADREELERALHEELEALRATMAEQELQETERLGVEQELRERLAAAEAQRAVELENMQALAAETERLQALVTELEVENAKLRMPVETAKRVAATAADAVRTAVDAMPEAIKTVSDAVPDSVKEGIADTGRQVKRRVVAIQKKVTDWAAREPEEQEGPEEEQEGTSVKIELEAELEILTPEQLLEKCKTRLGEVAREFNQLYQNVVDLEKQEQEEPQPEKKRLDHLSSIKEILDRVRNLGSKK